MYEGSILNECVNMKPKVLNTCTKIMYVFRKALVRLCPGAQGQPLDTLFVFLVLFLNVSHSPVL